MSTPGETPGSGVVTAVLTGQNTFAPDQAGLFASTHGAFTFGVCDVASNEPQCTVDPTMVPKALDVPTPSGVSQSNELDYILHSSVTL